MTISATTKHPLTTAMTTRKAFAHADVTPGRLYAAIQATAAAKAGVPNTTPSRTQAAARHLIRRGYGKIVNIASLLSFQGGIRIASHTAAKSGLAGLTRLLACEWASRGVNVNAVAPGYVETNNTEALRQDPVRNRQILERIRRVAGHSRTILQAP